MLCTHSDRICILYTCEQFSTSGWFNIGKLSVKGAPFLHIHMNSLRATRNFRFVYSQLDDTSTGQQRVCVMTITFKCHRTRWINAIFLSWRRIIIYFCRRDSRNKFFHQENVRARVCMSLLAPSSHYNNYALAAPQQRVASGLRPAAPPALYSYVIIRAAVWFLADGIVRISSSANLIFQSREKVNSKLLELH
jgi:hypothetical protein